jgi:hypothetical protein
MAVSFVHASLDAGSPAMKRFSSHVSVASAARVSVVDPTSREQRKLS